MKLSQQIPYQDHAHLWIGPNLEKTLDFATEHLLAIAQDSIHQRGLCTIALSGGSTPKAIYQRLAIHEDRDQVDWSRVFLFFSDERSVEPTSSQSNYYTAMNFGMESLGIPEQNIFRMQAETDLPKGAKDYEALITTHVPGQSFDLVMLGVGEDGHTASLFPQTEALKETKRLVVENEVPQQNTWRMTFTFPLINQARNIAVYALGERKQKIIKDIFKIYKDKPIYPSQKVGSSKAPALWILDRAAAEPLLDQDM